MDNSDTNFKLICDLCHASFTMKDILQKHLNTHISHLNQQKLVFIELNPYQSTTIETIDLTCNLCKASYAMMEKLQKHLNIHIGIGLNQFDLCEARFTHHSQLKIHSRIHRGGETIQV